MENNEIIQYGAELLSAWDGKFVGEMCRLLGIEYYEKKLYHWFENVRYEKILPGDPRNVFVMMDKNDKNRFVLLDNCQEEENYVLWVIQLNKSEEEKYKPLIIEKLKSYSNSMLRREYGVKEGEEHLEEPIYNEKTWTDCSKEEGNIYKMILDKYYVENMDEFIYIRGK